jgi:hypothetical protein
LDGATGVRGSYIFEMEEICSPRKRNIWVLLAKYTTRAMTAMLKGLRKKS